MTPTDASRATLEPDALVDTSVAVPLVVADHAAAELLARLGALGIAGGAVYDALVGAAAVEHGLTLMTRDRRAVDTYRRLDVKFVLVD